MSAIIKACKISTSVRNTGKECDSAMVATAMLIVMERATKITDEDLNDPVAWLTDLIHLRKAFPLFGQQAPIREITNDTEGDQIVTLDDGLKVFLRYGLYNRMFATTSGGLCYANALQSFLNSGMDVAEIDQLGQLLLRKNSADPLGDYSPLITDFMYSPAPVLADFKTTPYKNRFSYSYSPTELVANGVIFKGATALLSMMGLIEVTLTADAAASTTTALKINMVTECAEDDLAGKFGSEMVTAGGALWSVHDVTDLDTPISITDVNVSQPTITLTGTFVSGHTYRVTGSAPDNWQDHDIEGYDATSGSVDITVP